MCSRGSLSCTLQVFCENLLFYSKGLHEARGSHLACLFFFAFAPVQKATDKIIVKPALNVRLLIETTLTPA